MNGSFPVAKAIQLLETAAQLGFGEVATTEPTHNRRKVQKFRKYRYQQLAEAAKETLAGFDITSQTYEATFADCQPSTSNTVKE